MTVEYANRFDRAVSEGDGLGRSGRGLLSLGMIAGPLWFAVVLVQALLRPGFDLRHDDASLLSNGDLGWIQIANFIVVGALMIAFGIGVMRSLGRERAGKWGPRLFIAAGVATIGAGAFVADPMNGFPPGTPPGLPVAFTVHGTLHIITSSLTFVFLIATCFVFARRFAAEHRRGRASFSVATGIVFLIAFGAVASGSESTSVVVPFYCALALMWGWVTSLAVHLYRRPALGAPASKAA
jgi:uncharacterized membrane protein YozB (DUF420 family)